MILLPFASNPSNQPRSRRLPSWRWLALLVSFFAVSGPAQAVELRILCWEGYAPATLVAQFEKEMTAKYSQPVKVVVKYVSNGDEFFPALRNNTADIVSPSHNLPHNRKNPLFPITLPLDLSRIPNYAHLAPALQKLKFHTKDSVVHAVPLLYGPYGLAYNSSRVPTAPTSWKILLDSSYVGQYALAGDYPETNIYVAALIAGVAKDDLGSFDKVNTPAVRDALRKLVAGAGRFWMGVDKVSDLKGLALGTTWGFSLPDLRGQGEPWELAWPVEGTTAYIDGFMINRSVEKNPTLRAIADEWLNFVLSEDAQLNYMRSLGAYPARALDRSHVTGEETARYHLDDPGFFQRTFVLWPVLDERASNGYNQMWEAAKSRK